MNSHRYVVKVLCRSHKKPIKRFYTENGLKNEIKTTCDRYHDAAFSSTADDFRDQEFIDRISTGEDRSKVLTDLVTELYDDVMSGVILYCDHGQTKRMVCYR